MKHQEINRFRPKRFWESGPLALDTLKSRAYIGNVDLGLTEEQFNALYLLVQREGEAMSFEELYKAVWEPLDECGRREEAQMSLVHLAEQCTALGKGEIFVEMPAKGSYRFLIENPGL